MKRTRSQSTITIAIVGTIIFVLVLTAGTILTGLMASKDTEKAVESVSLFYLDELAGRREQVVSDNLSKKIEDMNVALELMEKSDPGYYDAILMDVRMPEMDGLAATEAIRALGREDAKAIPIIAMTANAFDEDVQRSLQVGMNAHLSKPVEPDRLYQTLEELIWDYDQAKADKN